MPLFHTTVTRDEFEFVVEADDEAQVRAACVEEDFGGWGSDPRWKVESVNPIEQDCKPDIVVISGKFGEWQGGLRCATYRGSGKTTPTCATSGR
jgi:hypothetical protein